VREVKLLADKTQCGDLVAGDWHRKVEILSFVALKSVAAMLFYTVLCCVLSPKTCRLFDLHASFVF
jgi:hypothetical protein